MYSIYIVNFKIVYSCSSDFLFDPKIISKDRSQFPSSQIEVEVTAILSNFQCHVFVICLLWVIVALWCSISSILEIIHGLLKNCIYFLFVGLG